MGIAGGQVKGSSGYAFQFIQKRTVQIVQTLKRNGDPCLSGSFTEKKFRYYDGVLLRILQRRQMQGADIFAAIFRNNPAERVLCFLDNETGWREDLQIMRSVPPGIFLPAGMIELIKTL